MFPYSIQTEANDKGDPERQSETVLFLHEIQLETNGSGEPEGQRGIVLLPQIIKFN